MTDPDWLNTCRRIVAEKSMMRYQRQAIDLFTASAIVTVWDKISDANREKLERSDDAVIAVSGPFVFMANKYDKGADAQY